MSKNKNISDPLKNNTKIKVFWGKLSPENKKKIVVGGILLVFVIIVFMGVSNKKTSMAKIKAQQTQENSKETVLNASMGDKNLIEETIVEKSKRQAEELEASLELIQLELAKLKEERQSEGNQKTKIEENNNDNTQLKPIEINSDLTLEETELPEPPTRSTTRFVDTTTVPSTALAQNAEQLQIQRIGGIDSVHQTVAQENIEDTDENETEIIHLPPSFMEATTLTGLTARTINGGEDKLMPIIMRIKDLAVLPNRVKSNLKDCYVFAEGTGDLATLRIDARLTTLACVAKNGTAVIEESIEGWIEDEDGQVGLSAIPRADMGTHLSRAFIIGALGGVGDALSEAQTTDTLSVLGTTSSIYTEDSLESIMTSGLGSGLSYSANELADLYMDLAEATMPVLQAGAEKNVTVVIKKGVDLKIKDVVLSQKG